MPGADYEIGIRMRRETYDGVTLIAASGYPLGKERLAAGCGLSFLNGREFSETVITGIGSVADEGQRSLVGTLQERE